MTDDQQPGWRVSRDRSGYYLEHDRLHSQDADTALVVYVSSAVLDDQRDALAALLNRVAADGLIPAAPHRRCAGAPSIDGRGRLHHRHCSRDGTMQVGRRWYCPAHHGGGVALLLPGFATEDAP